MPNVIDPVKRARRIVQEYMDLVPAAAEGWFDQSPEETPALYLMRDLLQLLATMGVRPGQAVGRAVALLFPGESAAATDPAPADDPF
ncbi:hypothetical protein [Bailinhaonella thermotolerans]|uniref:hypothetical protein n=1 Tax=Bailinhaonella thermotolerans TaxID=1070861 RepID=UPI00192A5B77|nr:hypothetical protein [Bailinhaonella thermotolerans]